jgi:hypothetical protein
MKRPARRKLRILVVDIGGSYVKCAVTGRAGGIEFVSGPGMTPARMMKAIPKALLGWRYDVVSIGYPGVVRNGKILREPNNLASGWVGFDFHSAFGCPVRIINDAAMQALGGYAGGRMLFLGLGTGLGSALIIDGVVAPLELGHLRYGKTSIYEEQVGSKARKRLGNRNWRSKVGEVIESFRNALLPDYVLLGGGNVAHLKKLPPQTRIGDNADAVLGGFRLWDPAA